MLKIANHELQATLDFLTRLPAKPALSRARTRLCARIETALQDLAIAEMELVKTYGKTGDDGNPLINKDGSFPLKDPSSGSEFTAEHQRLLDETITFSLNDYEQQAGLLKQLIENLDIDLSGQDAKIYDLLATQIGDGDE